VPATDVPGGYLSTNKAILYEAVLAVFNNSGSDRTITVKIYYGSTSKSLGALTITNSANLGQVIIKAWCVGYNATNAQKLLSEIYYIDTGASARGTTITLPAASTEDSTATLQAKMSAQLSVANANTYFEVLHARISLMPIA